VIYFGVNKSIYDWLYTYFTINFTSYAENYPFLYRFYLTLAGITSQIRSNPFTGGILWLGIISFIVFPKFVKTKLHRIGLFLCVFLLVFGVFSGGRGYIYTTLITSPFIIFGVQVIFDLINGIFKKEMVVLSPFLLTLSIAIICLVATILVNQNTYFMKIKKSGLVQYKFASIINQSENPSLLNYGSLDLGFYFASGIIPNQKYFINLNFDYSRYPSILDEQNRYIKDKLIDYVVIALPDEESVKDLNTLTPVLVNNYHMIRKENQAYDNYEYIYLLFKKNP